MASTTDSKKKTDVRMILFQGVSAVFHPQVVWYFLTSLMVLRKALHSGKREENWFVVKGTALIFT